MKRQLLNVADPRVVTSIALAFGAPVPATAEILREIAAAHADLSPLLASRAERALLREMIEAAS